MRFAAHFAKWILERTPTSVQFAGWIPGSLRKLAEQIDAQIQLWAIETVARLPLKELEELQSKKLSRIIWHAIRTVPYWHHWGTKLAWRESFIEEFRRLPIHSRGDLRIIPRKYLSAVNISQERFIAKTTSGSTGEPFFFYQDRAQDPRRLANIFFEFKLQNSVLQKPILIIGIAAHTWLDLLGWRFPTLDIEDAEKRKELYRFMNTEHPQHMIGTPSLLKRLAEVLILDSQPAPKFKAIQYTGELFPENQKKSLEEFFGCRIFGQYGSQECSRIGIECIEGNFHTCPWLNYIEIIDDNGKTLPTGQSGRIVVTFFENQVMPFIRYELGDRGSLSNERCSCGLTTAVIHFSGRKPDSIVTLSGKTIALLTITTQITNRFTNEIRHLQLEQTSPSHIVFRFVAASLMNEEKERELRAFINQIGDHELGWSIKAVEAIPPNESGKTPIFIKSF